MLPRFAGELDQPSADGLNTWLISRAAARDVKGVLSGVGGDEWFAGYPVAPHRALRDDGRWPGTSGDRRIGPLSGRPRPAGISANRIENLATRRNALATWLQSHTVFRYDRARHMAGLGADRTLEVARFAALLNLDSNDWTRESPIGIACLLDTRVYMTQQLLRDSDATSMRIRWSCRPVRRFGVADFSRSCNDEFKLRGDGGSSSQYYGSGSKRVLIHALRDLLPLAISNRPKKGFALPFEHWMRGELASTVEETCCHETIKRRGLIDPNIGFASAQQRGRQRPRQRYPGLWTLMIFELWCRAVLDKYRHPAVAGHAVGV